MPVTTLPAGHIEASPQLPAVIAYVVFALATITFLHPTVIAMVAMWLQSSSFNHGVLIAPIAIWLMATDQRAKMIAPAPTFWASGIVALAAIVWLLGRAGNAELIEEIALVSLLIAGVVTVFGLQLARIWVFPLGFLYFMVPFGGSLIPALQHLTASVVVSVLSFSGIPVTADGVLINTSAGAFEIAEACAGFRFLISAVMISTLFSYLAFVSWRKRGIFIGFAIALALTANIIRAFFLIILATLTEKKFGVGPEHILIGWFFYGAVFLTLIVIGRKFSDRRPFDGALHPVTAFKGRSQLIAAIIPLIAILLITSTYARIVIDRHDGVAPTVLPLLSASGWRITPPDLELQARFTGADRAVHASYQDDITQVQTSIAYYAYDRPGAEVISSGNRGFEKFGWRETGARTFEIDGLGVQNLSIKVRFLRGPHHQRIAVTTLYWLGDDAYDNPTALKFHQMRERLVGIHKPGGLIVVVAPIASDEIMAAADIAKFLHDSESIPVWRNRIAVKATQ